MSSDMFSVPGPAVSGLDSARVFLGETTQEAHTQIKGSERGIVNLPGPDPSCFSDLQIPMAPPLPSPEVVYLQSQRRSFLIRPDLVSEGPGTGALF